MTARLCPAYIERPAWAAYDAYMNFLDTDDFEDLRRALTDLRDGLLRAQAIKYAPDYVLADLVSA
jgi:hypothetical protein